MVQPSLLTVIISINDLNIPIKVEMVRLDKVKLKYILSTRKL